jgi:hypothetical protein
MRAMIENKQQTLMMRLPEEPVGLYPDTRIFSPMEGV